MNIRLRSKISLVVLIGTWLGAAWFVTAAASRAIAEELQEVVITATLRPQPSLDLAASVTVLDSRTLRVAGVQHLVDVLPLVPNLNWASGSSRPRYFQLRGIGETDQWQGAPNPSVGFLIDGMDFSGIGMPATLLDLGQVEVLRGPQGTVFGANALAGLINVQTQAAEPIRSLRFEASAGDYGVNALGLVAGDAWGDGGESAWRVIAQGFRGDGSRRNATLGREDTNGFDERTLRFRATHRFGERWQADLSLLDVDLDNGFDAFSTDNSRVTRSDDPGRDRQRSRGASLRLRSSGDRFEFRSVTALVDADILYSFDGDWAADPGYDFTSRFLRNRRGITQDLRWSALGESEWIAGVYAQRLREANDQLDLYDGEVYRAVRSDYRADTLAAYASRTHALGADWRVNLGARVEHRDANYRDTDGSDLAPAETMAGGDLSIEYRPDDQRRVYLTMARGYKAGGFNIGSVVPVDRREFDAELLDSIELGYKFFDATRGLRYELAAFHMRRREQQVSTSAQLDPGDPLSFIYLTDNAARGVNEGLEGSLSTALGERWRLGATLGLLRTRFVDYVVAGQDLSGRGQAHAPRHQASISLEYEHPRGWFARADAQQVAAFFFSDSHAQRSRPYCLVNLRAGYALERWRAEFWVRNALDENYAMRGFFFGNEPPDFPDRLYVQLAEPRTLGLTVNWKVR
ncbi:MAG: TonB-dependent receptor [Steroidobacteraceae bacterium]